jgi:hypothetical protein
MQKNLCAIVVVIFLLAPIGVWAGEPSIAMQIQMLIHQDQKSLQKAQAAVNSGDLVAAKKDFLRIAHLSMFLQKKTPPKGSSFDWTKDLQALAKHAFEGAHFVKTNDSVKIRTSITALASVLSDFQREFQ